MTDEKINAAIADAISPRLVLGDSQFYKSGDGWVVDCPNYCTDLNAMHEAEKVLNKMQWFYYLVELNSIVRFKGQTKVQIKQAVHATARQRAEAFLRTIGKWQEDSSTQK
jgi:hypothetical protein